MVGIKRVEIGQVEAQKSHLSVVVHKEVVELEVRSRRISTAGKR